jgi:hypothetical protein
MLYIAKFISLPTPSHFVFIFFLFFFIIPIVVIVHVSAGRQYSNSRQLALFEDNVVIDQSLHGTINLQLSLQIPLHGTVLKKDRMRRGWDLPK